MMKVPGPDDKETERKRDEVLKRMLQTPPKPHKDKTKKGSRKKGSDKHEM